MDMDFELAILHQTYRYVLFEDLGCATFGSRADETPFHKLKYCTLYSEAHKSLKQISSFHETFPPSLLRTISTIAFF